MTDKDRSETDKVKTRLSAGAIVRKCGFQSENRLRHSFNDVYQTSPHSYRERFGLKRG